MKKTYRLVVESGPDQGKSFAVPERGCGLGRSSQNDIALRDEQLSRLHCRFHFREGEPWVTDLASANGTLVDGVEVTEQRLAPGNRIAVGDSTLRLLVEGDSDVPVPPGVLAAAPAAVTVTPIGAEPGSSTSDAGDPTVDLGFAGSEREEGPAAEHRLKRTLLWSLASFVILISVALIIRQLLESPVDTPRVRPIPTAESPKTLELRYEKVEGTVDNLFRYELALDAQGRLAVEIDDLAQRRHVRRESPAAVDPALVQELVLQVQQSGFLGLDPSYEGIALPNTHTAYDLTVILGVDARRVRVANRNEPDPFRLVRERIETFARNELGLWAVEFPREKLEQLARDAFLLGAKLLREKDIQTGNLYAATQSFRECAHYLDTVEPKPAFLAEALTALRGANDELEVRFKDLNLDADRAINLKDWDVAAGHLRAVLELVPDRSDDRYRDAERRLLDVESRLKNRR